MCTASRDSWITFIETVGDIGNQQTEKPVTIADMEQSLCYIDNGQQGGQLYREDREKNIIKSNILPIMTLQEKNAPEANTLQAS